MYLSTRICSYPTTDIHGYNLSYDYAIWKSTEKVNKINQLYVDSAGFEIKEEDIEHFQPKNATFLNFFEENFYPCILKIQNKDKDEWLQATHFYPQQEIYTVARLISVGYDVMDLSFISIASHGLSAQYEEDTSSLNKFNLFKNFEIANKYLNLNKTEIPEHSWNIVEIFVNKGTYDVFNLSK